MIGSQKRSIRSDHFPTDRIESEAIRPTNKQRLRPAYIRYEKAEKSGLTQHILRENHHLDSI